MAPVVLMRHVGWGPRDAVAFTAATGVSVAIVVNALFLQSGPHPAPLFKPPPLAAARGEMTNSVPVMVPRARPVEAISTKPEMAPPAPVAPRPAAHGEAASEAPSHRVMALQRALAQFGYGQIKPTGVLDADTRAAIEKFERERKLPVTGQPSDRVVKELAGLIGRQID
jgi:hypothetical protein